MASIGANLDLEIDEAFCHFLGKNWDIFTSHPLDIPGIPRGLAEHILNILKVYKPVKQALLHFFEPKCQAMGEELAKLLRQGLSEI